MARSEELFGSDTEIVQVVSREQSRAILAKRLDAAIEARELAEQHWRDHERRYGAELDSTIHAALERAGIESFEKF